MDTDVLLTLGVAPQDYIIAKFLWQGTLGPVKRYHYLTPQTVEESLARLAEKKIITYTGGMPDNIPIDKERIFKFLFPIRKNAFYELFNAYPHKVDKKGTTRVLRVLGMDTAGAQRMKAKYEKITKNDKRKHLIVMKCLEAELWERKRNDNMGFMVELARYIDEQLWEKYLPYIEKKLDQSPNTAAFGSPDYGQEEF